MGRNGREEIDPISLRLQKHLLQSIGGIHIGFQGEGAIVEGGMAQLRTFWESFCSPNGFHLNGDFKKRGHSSFHYRPFTLESNMYAADALQEMLLQTRGTQVSLFPAIPEQWNHGSVSFTGFRGENGLVVSAALEDGQLRSLRLRSEKPQRITLSHPSLRDGQMTVRLEPQADQTYDFN